MAEDPQADRPKDSSDYPSPKAGAGEAAAHSPDSRESLGARVERSAGHRWLRRPESWIALSAATLSLLTFFLTYAYPGKLEIVLPDRLGLLCSPMAQGAARPSAAGAEPVAEVLPRAVTDLLIPVTFIHSGAERTRWNVRRIHATFTPVRSEPTAGGAKSEAGTAGSAKLTWHKEVRFIGKDQYVSKYGKGQDEDVEDFYEYVNRAFPLTLAGGEAVTRVFHFRVRSGTIECASAQRFELRLWADTTRRSDTEVATKYRCQLRQLLPARPAKGDKSPYVWCEEELVDAG